MTDRKTRRRGREAKRRAQGTSAFCESYGHDWTRDLYGSEKLPPGYILQTCNNCPRERAVMVRGPIR